MKCVHWLMVSVMAATLVFNTGCGPSGAQVEQIKKARDDDPATKHVTEPGKGPGFGKAEKEANRRGQGPGPGGPRP